MIEIDFSPVCSSLKCAGQICCCFDTPKFRVLQRVASYLANTTKYTCHIYYCVYLNQ